MRRNLKKHAPPGQFDVFPSYKGGRTTTYGGYVWESCPGHRLANHWGFVAQHRLIGEDILGRPMEKDEVVHHKDQVRTNNDLSNLEVMTRDAHRKLHSKLNRQHMQSPLSEDEVKQALKTHGSIKAAARSLGVSHSTVRNRFPELVAPYKRVSPTKIDDPRDIEKVLKAAPDPDIGLRELMKEVKMTASTILRICDRRGVKWVKKRRDDKPRMQYRGKPTRRCLEEAHGSDLALGNQRIPHPQTLEAERRA